MHMSIHDRAGPSCRFRLDLPLKGKDGSQPHSTHSPYSPCLSNVETCSVVQPGGVGTCLQESTRHFEMPLEIL